MMECFFEDGLNFSCTKCSNCCRGKPGFVFLSKNDLTNLAEWFNLSLGSFVDSFCRKAVWRDGTSVVSLIEKENFDCVFWQDGKGCSVYEARPVQCKTYPFWKRVIADKNAWKVESMECPGIGSGKLWSKDEVLDQMQRHALNHPVLWDDMEAFVLSLERR